MRILIIEDDHRLAVTIADLVTGETCEADIADNGEDGLYMLLDGIYDAAILDVMLPKMNGFEVLRQLRMKKQGIPVLMLTARTAVRDKVKGLDSGADYYLTKPFDNDELLAALRSILRRPHTLIADEPTFADLKLNPASASISCGNCNISLSSTEYKLAELLFRNQGQYLSKDTILRRVWGFDADVGENSVEAYVSFLRKKLLLLGSQTAIVSVRGIGYRIEEQR